MVAEYCPAVAPSLTTDQFFYRWWRADVVGGVHVESSLASQTREKLHSTKCLVISEERLEDHVTVTFA